MALCCRGTCRIAPRMNDEPTLEVKDIISRMLWARPAAATARAAEARGLDQLHLLLVEAGCLMIALLSFALGLHWLGMVFGVATSLGHRTSEIYRGADQQKAGDVLQALAMATAILVPLAWFVGLARAGHPLELVYGLLVVGAIWGCRLIEWIVAKLFSRRFGFGIERWRPVDATARLVTAGRNIDLLILLGSLLFGRPDIGLQLVALWSIVSLIFHAVRLAQANARADRGRKIRSWLA